MNFRKNGLWLTGQWGFTPEKWGVVGFTRHGDRENFLNNSSNGTIVAIYITSTDPINTGLALKVVGFVKVSREKGCSKKFVCKKLWKENQDNLKAETAGKWFYGVQITKAWVIESEGEDVSVKTIFNHAYDPNCGMNIATRGVPVKEEEDFAEVDRLTIREVPVFKPSAQELGLG